MERSLSELQTGGKEKDLHEEYHTDAGKRVILEQSFDSLRITAFASHELSDSICSWGNETARFQHKPKNDVNPPHLQEAK